MSHDISVSFGRAYMEYKGRVLWPQSLVRSLCK